MNFNNELRRNRYESVRLKRRRKKKEIARYVRVEEITRRDNGGRNKNDKRARVLLFIVTDGAR